MKAHISVERALIVAGIAAIAACGSSSTTNPAAPNDAGGNAGIDAGTDAPTTGSEAGADAGVMGFGFVPSNVPLTEFPASVGDVTISSSTCVADTTMLTVDCVGPGPDGGLPYTFVSGTQSDGSPVSVLSVNSLTVASAGALAVKGSSPLIIWALTDVNLRGPIIADPAFHMGGNAGGSVATASGTGGGPGGGGPGKESPEIGASGGGYCGVGGAGGNSEMVSMDAGAPIPGGKAYGNASIVPLLPGSSGGANAGFGGGGEGGGAIEIAAGSSIVVGTGGVVSVPGFGGDGNGGAGGSGGAILLEAPSVTIDGVLAANGGGAAVFSGGGSNQDGQPSAQPAMGQDANSAVGSAGTQINGGDGMATTTATSSGGGGAGRIRINTTKGMATIGAGAIISPDPTTACVTQGTLTPRP
jgi:hypothetical protein